jgi:hypothetical protein
MSEKGNKVVSLADRSNRAKHAGICETLQLVAQKYIDNTLKSSRMIIILDEEGDRDVHVFAVGVDIWDGVAMCEIAKSKLIYDDEE